MNVTTPLAQVLIFFSFSLNFFEKQGQISFAEHSLTDLKKMRKLRKTATLGTKVAQTSDSNLLLHKPVILGIICCKEL